LGIGFSVVGRNNGRNTFGTKLAGKDFFQLKRFTGLGNRTKKQQAEAPNNMYDFFHGNEYLK
jgi:hypothetical protein